MGGAVYICIQRFGASSCEKSAWALIAIVIVLMIIVKWMTRKYL